VDLRPWWYFLSIEKQFVETLNFVDLDPKNVATFSNEFAKLLLLIGSEVDVIAKMICAGLPGGATAKSITHYCRVLTTEFPGIETIEIEVERYPGPIVPWSGWKQNASPSWWKAHTDVKHHRDKAFGEANQGNVLYAICGLFALLLYYYRADDIVRLEPHPQLVSYPILPQVLVGQNLRYQGLPGVR